MENSRYNPRPDKNLPILIPCTPKHLNTLHMRTGSITSSASSGSFGSSAFVSTSIQLEDANMKENRNTQCNPKNIQSFPASPSAFPKNQFLPSQHSAFSQPPPTQAKNSELEIFTNQWQVSSCRKQRSSCGDKGTIDNKNEQNQPKTWAIMYREEPGAHTILPGKKHRNINHYNPAEVLPSLKCRTLPRLPKDRNEKEELQLKRAQDKNIDNNKSFNKDKSAPSPRLHYSHSLPRKSRQADWMTNRYDAGVENYQLTTACSKMKKNQDSHSMADVGSLVKHFEHQALNKSDGQSCESNKEELNKTSENVENADTGEPLLTNIILNLPDEEVDAQSLVPPPEQFIDRFIDKEDFEEQIKENLPSMTLYNECDKSRNRPDDSISKLSVTSLKNPTSRVPESPNQFSPTSFTSSGTNSLSPTMNYSIESSRSHKKKLINIQKQSTATLAQSTICTSAAKTRQEFIEEFLDVRGTEFDDITVLLDREKKSRKNKILSLENATQELYFALVTRVKVMREEKACLEQEYEENEMEWKMLEESFREAAEGSKVDKFMLHWSEIRKIVALILSLTGRLVKVVNILDNMEWNGVDEREDLERKRDKLEDQLKEAKLIWHKIDKRTQTVSGYIEEYLTRLDRIRFGRMIRRKVRLMLEMSEMQEKLELAEKQLKAIDQN